MQESVSGWSTILFDIYQFIVSNIGNPEITLSNNPNITHSTLPPDINTADVTILTLNVILQASVEGIWQKPDGTNIDGNVIVFDVFTRDLAGLYKFFTVENETPTLVIQIQISVTGKHH